MDASSNEGSLSSSVIHDAQSTSAHDAHQASDNVAQSTSDNVAQSTSGHVAQQTNKPSGDASRSNISDRQDAHTPSGQEHASIIFTGDFTDVSQTQEFDSLGLADEDHQDHHFRARKQHDRCRRCAEHHHHRAPCDEVSRPPKVAKDPLAHLRPRYTINSPTLRSMESSDWRRTAAPILPPSPELDSRMPRSMSHRNPMFRNTNEGSPSRARPNHHRSDSGGRNRTAGVAARNKGKQPARESPLIGEASRPTERRRSSTYLDNFRLLTHPIQPESPTEDSWLSHRLTGTLASHSANTAGSPPFGSSSRPSAHSPTTQAAPPPPAGPIILRTATANNNAPVGVSMTAAPGFQPQVEYQGYQANPAPYQYNSQPGPQYPAVAYPPQPVRHVQPMPYYAPQAYQPPPTPWYNAPPVLQFAPPQPAYPYNGPQPRAWPDYGYHPAPPY